MDDVLKDLPSKYVEAIDDLGKARAYIAELEREKVKLIRERVELLSIINGVSRQMAEVAKAHKL